MNRDGEWGDEYTMQAAADFVRNLLPFSLSAKPEKSHCVVFLYIYN